MNIFIYTNVILEGALRREEFEIARELYERIKRQDDRMFISAGSFYSVQVLTPQLFLDLDISK
jgi:hypothetical protein